MRFRLWGFHRTITQQCVLCFCFFYSVTLLPPLGKYQKKCWSWRPRHHQPHMELLKQSHCVKCCGSCCCGNRFVECLWVLQAPAGFGGGRGKKICVCVNVNQCWLEMPGWPNAHLWVLDWQTERVFKEKSLHLCVCVKTQRAESLIWVSKHKQQINKQTAGRVVPSPDAVTVTCIQGWTGRISSSPPAAASVLSCHILFITCRTVTRSNKHSAFSLDLRPPLISEASSHN